MSEVFDAYAGNYADEVQASIDFAGLPHDFYLRAKALLLAEVVQQRLGIGGALSCLDVGCGVGALHPHIAPLFDHLAGVDVSVASIAEASRRRPAGVYRSYDGTRLPFEDDTFDVALTVCVMHHVPPGAWGTFVDEMRRVVRPGGLVAVIEHNPYNPLTRFAVSRCAFDADAVLLPARRVANLFAASGLTGVAVRHFLLLPSLARAARLLEALVAGMPLGAQYMAFCMKPGSGDGLRRSR